MNEKHIQLDQVLNRLASDLERMTGQVEDAMERCRELLDIQAAMPVDVQRDAQHLYARVEATSIQLENTIRTLERLVRRISIPAPIEPRSTGRVMANPVP